MLRDRTLWWRKVVIVIVTKHLTREEALVYVTVRSGRLGLALVIIIKCLSIKILGLPTTRGYGWSREAEVATQNSSHYPPNPDSESDTRKTEPPELVEPY
jgi:hypothetical protein